MSKKDNKKQHHKKPQTPGTTGHQWDGIEEYNTPAPRWWLIVWLVTIVWSVIYWFFFPTWPTLTGHTKGIGNWSSHSELAKKQDESKQKLDIYRQKIKRLSLEDIKKNPDLIKYAIAAGKSSFKQNCVGCHGTGAAGSKGFPNLNDDDWIWGGKIEDIYQTIKYGIRSEHPKARDSQMPAFGADGILNEQDIKSVTKHVLYLSGKEGFSKKGKEIFINNCASCHGNDGKGNREFGAPNLTDAIWLYGGNMKDITNTIFYSRYGAMPNWYPKLDDVAIKELAIYVYFLGGGE